MGRIRVLSDAVANQIAAGEVVERPASVVKELVENSLDAGATEISVQLEGGGRRLIRVVDNGSGMIRDDALLAFERHATSKLRTADDLLSISTLGFRGEALPSVASVSRLLLETRSPDETTGTTVEFAGGKLLRCDESALRTGTIITARDLFYNVPARRKFLRSEQTELAQVASLVTHYSLAHTSKAFELWHGGSQLLSVTPVRELRERVYQVLGAQTLDELVDLDYHEKTLTLANLPDDDGGERVFSLRGFASRPQLQKGNRNSIFLFVNNRMIRDKLLLHALSAAYHNLMPPGSYPVALLFIDCDCEEVDINVHPSKTEVRFRHSSFVHDFVRDRVREVLMVSRPASSIMVPVLTHAQAQAQAAAALPYSEFTQRIENDDRTAWPSQPFPFDAPSSDAPADDAPAEADLPVYRVAAPSPPLDTPPLRLPVPDSHGVLPAGVFDQQPSMTVLRDLRPLGQLQDSFIVAAARDGLWLIDQHVAHERILFEKVLRERARGGVQMQRLLLPLVLQLTASEELQYARIADELNSSGFETEPFGSRTITIKAAPSDVPMSAIEKIVFEILELSDRELRSASVADLRRGIAASVACQAAIKVNMHLDMSKMEWLLRELEATEYPMSCPHGRPVALRYSTRDILKAFHRI